MTDAEIDKSIAERKDAWEREFRYSHIGDNKLARKEFFRIVKVLNRVFSGADFSGRLDVKDDVDVYAMAIGIARHVFDYTKVYSKYCKED